MKKIGIVGFGSIGSMLAEALLRTGAIPAHNKKRLEESYGLNS